MPLPPRVDVYNTIASILVNLNGVVESLDALIARLPANALRTNLIARRANLVTEQNALDNLFP